MNNKSNGQANIDADEFHIQCIRSDLGLNIVTSFMLGRKVENKTRTLKIMLAEKSQRKFILDNAKFIPTIVRSNFKDVIISKDSSTEERKWQFIINKSQGLSKGERYKPNAQADLYK